MATHLRDLELEEMSGACSASTEATAAIPVRVPRVVIVGAGLGGLAAAMASQRAKVAVTLIDRRNYHLFQPLLYHVAYLTFERGSRLITGEAGTLKGTVETISIRSLRLRHHRGAVHTVPYGELKALTNHSRDWVIVKLEFLVTYDTDVDQVKKLLKRIGQEMLEDPALGPNLIETVKSQGINQLADHGLLVRAKFTAKPGEQFAIKRDALQRIKRAFDAAGIKVAYPTVTIHSSAGTATPDEAVQAAAKMALRAPVSVDGAPAPA